FFFLLFTYSLPTFTPFPYTTLFRSLRPASWKEKSNFHALRPRKVGLQVDNGHVFPSSRRQKRTAPQAAYDTHDRGHRRRNQRLRSEEHTSELQSRVDLVCRLLLEKK